MSKEKFYDYFIRNTKAYPPCKSLFSKGLAYAGLVSSEYVFPQTDLTTHNKFIPPESLPYLAERHKTYHTVRGKKPF